MVVLGLVAFRFITVRDEIRQREELLKAIRKELQEFREQIVKELRS